MSDMVEKVARAIREADPSMQYPRAISCARAAISAMRGDPGHDITAAVVKPTEDRREAVRYWSAMMEAALTPTSAKPSQ